GENLVLVTGVAFQRGHPGRTVMDGRAAANRDGTRGRVAQVAGDALDLKTVERAVVTPGADQYAYSLPIGQQAAHEVGAKVPRGAGHEDQSFIPHPSSLIPSYGQPAEPGAKAA